MTGTTTTRISIVVPALEEADNIERLLTDLGTRCPGAEVIVVDGGSLDGTIERAARFPGVTVLSGPRGRARQMNLGARASSGDVLLFLHADTRLPDDAVELVGRALARPDAVGGWFDVRFDNTRLIFRVIAALMNLRSRWTGICTGDQAIFVRRPVFEGLGGYAEIPLMEDIDLTRRLKRTGPVVCLRQRVVTAARKWEREGVWRTIVLMWTLRLLYVLGVDPRRLHRMYYRPGRPGTE
jgi:rSAM/selenodomain-associated transferase 2